MKLRNKKTGKIVELDHFSMHYNMPEEWGQQPFSTWNHSLAELNEEWEDYKPAEPFIKDDKICKIVREWAEYNETESVKVYNLVYDHGGVCIENALVRFYDPRLRTNIDVWFKKFEAPIFEDDREYTLSELCGEEEE